MRRRRSGEKKFFSSLVAVVILESLSFLVFSFYFYEGGVNDIQDDSLLNVDSVVYTDEIIYGLVEESVPNIIVKNLHNAGPSLNSTCGLYVNPLDIHYNNLYWQTQKNRNEMFYLYSAYYDNRPAADGNIIRIIGMKDQYTSTQVATCIMWFGDETPAIAPVFHAHFMWFEEWGHRQEPLLPYIFSCKVPESYGNRVPDSVSLVGDICDKATNNLKVIYNPAPNGDKKDFFVCVKGLNFKHNAKMAIRLVEWIELLKILGADKIDFYELHVHENITRVLEHYKQAGDIELIKTTLPGRFSNIPHLMGTYLELRLMIQSFQELIQYNDCFYRNMHKYRYVVLLDVDEVILPLGNMLTWQQLMYDATLPNAVIFENRPYASFFARNVMFMDEMKESNAWYEDVPKYMHMLQHVLRNKEHDEPGTAVKAFHNTDLILSLHNHYPRACIGDLNFYCAIYHIGIEDAHLQHYCYGRNKPECKTTYSGNLTRDTSIWKYKPRLTQAVKKTLKTTGFLHN